MLKRLKKQGFTLVELLVTIILLGLVAAIVIYNMTNVSKETKESDYERYIAAIKSAADVYATNNPEAFNDLYVSKAYVYFTIGDLVRSGLLDENLENPYTNETVDFDDRIKANLDSTTGDLKFEYPLDSTETETFLVTIADYVVWGEGYDCMQGAGSYQLSLSDEEGKLIMLNDQETIDQYNFKCALPDGFDPKVAGNYEVEYTWLTESGTRKSATRTLRVLPQVTPTFRTNVDYNFNEGNPDWFTPRLLNSGETQDANCPTGWYCLTYTPYIEGADPDSTTLKITKKGNNPSTSEQAVTNGFISTYDTYRADDGDKTYTLTTVVQGHYNKNYSYTAVGSERIKQKLIIPTSYIKTTSSDWSTNKNYQITEPYSPVGVKKYEFKLLTSSETANNADSNNPLNTFDKTGTVTTKPVDILGSGTCSARELSYPKIAFRAINNEGYVGDWTEVPANLTNNISTLISATSTSCTSSAQCCYKSGTSCYYTEKKMYLSYGSQRFVALERFSTGEVLAATEGVTQNAFSPNELVSGKWSINVCDGVYTAHFQYSSPSLQRIINEGTSFADSKLPTNYKNVLVNRQWAIDPPKSVQDSECIVWRGMTKCGTISTSHSYSSSPYTAYVGNVNSSIVSKYRNALYDTQPYWGTKTYGYNVFHAVSDPGTHTGEGTNVWNAYFYAYLKGSESTAYSGSNAYIKPLVQFRSGIYACSGNGTSSSPYVIAT